MPKVSIFSPAPITGGKFSRLEYIISYKQALAIQSKLLLQRQRKRLPRSHHGRATPTLPPSALVTDSVYQHAVEQNDISFTKASVLVDQTNAFLGDIGVNPHRWSPTVLRKNKHSPAPVSFRLSSRKTLLQVKDHPSTLRLFPSGQDKTSPKPSRNEVIYSQQSPLRSDSAALREWIASVIFMFVLCKDQRHQPRLPVCMKAIVMVAANIKGLSEIYPLHDDMVFLALWYAGHMMRDGLLDQFDLYQPHGIVLATRLFILSYTLAIKWLADENYFLQNWVPYYQQGFSLSSAKALDRAALAFFDHNLYIASSQWTAWLRDLDQWPSAHVFSEDKVHLVAQARIRKLLFKSETSSSSPRSRSIPISDTGAWNVHKILLDNLAISLPPPNPAPWNPDMDPIIHAAGRRQPLTQAPSPWSSGIHCYSPPLLVYDIKGEVQPELLLPGW